MTDGWDDASAYGFVHTLPLGAGPAGPSGSAGSSSAVHGPLRSYRVETRNSGLFYLAATHESLRLMTMLAARLGRESIWDQSAYQNGQSGRLGEAIAGLHGLLRGHVTAWGLLSALGRRGLMRQNPRVSVALGSARAEADVFASLDQARST